LMFRVSACASTLRAGDTSQHNIDIIIV